MKYLVVQAFWYFDTLTGEFRYRIKNPGEALAEHPDYHVVNIHVFHPLFAELALTADILILHLMPDQEVEQIIHLRKRLGKATVFEIADNFLNLGPWMAEDDAHRNPLIRGSFLHYARRCEGLQFSSAELIPTFGFLNDRNTVFENQGDHFANQRLPSRPFIFGWGGSKGHEEDLRQVVPVILAFLERHEDAVFRFMGFPPMFHRLFGETPHPRVELTPSGPIEAWFTFLEGLHVGLAPLSPSDFNRSRSDVKFVEYAAHGVVPVLRDAPPYRVHARHGDNAMIYKEPEELNDCLEKLYQDEGLLRSLSENTFRYASTRRSHFDHVGRRNTFYKRFLKHEPSTHEVPELPDCSGLINYLRVATDAYGRGEYPKAVETLKKVLGIHPQYGAAHIWMLKSLFELHTHRQILEVYGKWNPPAIYADLFFEVMARSVKALGFENWANIALKINDPVLRLEVNPDAIPDPEDRLNAKLNHNPFHHQSILELLELKLKQEQMEEARELLDRALFMTPEAQHLHDLKAKLA